MSDGRRSGRSKKQIDYAAFGDVDGSDDDFAASTPPPPKKQKKTNEKKEKAGKQEVQKENIKNKKSLNRKTPEELLFEQEVQEALELSRTDSNDFSETEDPKSAKDTEDKQIVHNDPSRRRISDDIEILEEPEKTELPSRRRSASKIVDDKDYSAVEDCSSDDDGSYVEDNNDSDSSYNGNDSDFDVGSKSKKSKIKKKKENTPKKQTGIKTTPVSTSTKPKTTSTAKEKAAVKATNGVSKNIRTMSTVSKTPARPYSAPSLSSPTAVVGLSNKKPAWTPPGAAVSGKSLGGIVIKSPSSGLRLGLSRNQRVKPLHPTLNIQP